MPERLLMTGAAGGVGRALRPLLKNIAPSVVLSDIVDINDCAAHESFVRCELSDASAVAEMVAGVDAVIHLGGISVERPFEQILQGNIIGLYNLFEAARRHGRPRIVFASSNHVVGYYRQDERIDSTATPKPDSLYGVSKAFGENIAGLYHRKFGQECLSVRIGSCLPKPKDRRTLATWLAAEDLADLCACAFEAPLLGHTIVYGASANEEGWWDNSRAAFLGWSPKHSSAKWRAEVAAAGPRPAPDDAVALYQGGVFVAAGHPDDG